MSYAEDLCDEIIAAKQGNNELAIFYCPWRPQEERWLVMLGNPCQHVMLGESDGELSAEGDCLDEALKNLHKLLEEHNGRQPTCPAAATAPRHSPED